MADSSSIFNFKDFARVAKRLAIFLLLMVVLDQALGRLLEHLYFRLDEGQFGPKINAAIKERAQLVVFGSSRAECHYDPAILARATGLSVFNAGFGGQSILFHYGLERLILEAYAPRLILLDLNIDDITTNGRRVAVDKLGILLPYRENEAVSELLALRGFYEPFRQLSAIYPYNSNILSIVKFSIQDASGPSKHGFEPLFGSKMEQLIVLAKAGTAPAARAATPAVEIDTTFVDAFIQAARDKGVPVVLVNSPRFHLYGLYYSETELKVLAEYRRYLKEMGVPLIEVTYEQVPALADPSLFSEAIHLNAPGAAIFSQELGVRLKQLGAADPAAIPASAPM